MPVSIYVDINEIRRPFQHPVNSLTARFRKISKLRDLFLEYFDRSEFWGVSTASSIFKAIGLFMLTFSLFLDDISRYDSLSDTEIDPA